MNDVTAVLDACVLYPAQLRDLLMRLAVFDAFRARWTETIHDEWIRNVLKDREDLTLEQLTRTRTLMDKHAREPLVEGYESLIETLELPDADDRHVLAAAIHAQADFIVTFNLRDFPDEKLAPFGIEPVHPDAFIVSLIEEDEQRVLHTAKNHLQSLKNPPKTIDEYLTDLHNSGLEETAQRLRVLFDAQT